MNTLKRFLPALFCILSLGAERGFAAGMLIPKDESIPPLAIESQRVDIRIKDGVATAKIEQVFRNSVNRDLEAVFVFPLPANASISDFVMMINGKRMSGELKERDSVRDEVATVKYVGKKVFTLLDGRWVDTAFKKEMKTVTVKFGSAEYFKLLTDKPNLKDVLALGTKVTVVLEDGTALVVE